MGRGWILGCLCKAEQRIGLNEEGGSGPGPGPSPPPRLLTLFSSKLLWPPFQEGQVPTRLELRRREGGGQLI